MGEVMKRILISFVVVFTFLSFVPETEAFIFRWIRRNRRSAVSSNYQVGGNVQQIAQQKANIQANRGRCFHPGGSFGGARYEGVGGGKTAQAALNNCCYSGARGSKGPRRNCVAAAVAQASNGWYYACRLYR